MICGNLLPAIAGPRAEFVISAPRIAAAGTLQLILDHPEEQRASVKIGVEGFNAELTLLTDAE
jgi:hypothetical protein